MFKLDPNSDTALYMQIVEQTKVSIAAGIFKNGDKFPSVRDLSRQLLINQTTVSKAFKELSRQGIIESKPGIGTIIKLNHEKIDTNRDDFLKKLEEDLTQAIFLKISKEEIISMYEKVEGEIGVI
ncbi:GntR family transcriptional regulator [uncultured Anaerococcus sp.]|uniref:GntR family transcriptional regulator n=1 Tax=uncultured Anaerococcus sp. TaxID=293428 RepID=UPI0025FF0DC4|nr:GntR family transcriptional regulator [uncultured Anaerococcus sp.]